VANPEKQKRIKGEPEMNKSVKIWITAAIVAVAATFAAVLVYSQISSPPEGETVKKDVPYVPTQPEVVERMLEMAKVGKNDVVYDLGCGDGRIVIAAVKDFGARSGVGVDRRTK
jgi:flagellar basal body-associated protein FliL